MDIPVNYRRFLIGISFLAASFFLYLGLAFLLLALGHYHLGDYHPTLFEKLFPVPFVVVSLILCWQIAWLIGRPGSAQTVSFRFPVVVGIVFVGAVLISLLIWRQHWVDLFRFS
jgi:hypothetical protein